MTRHQFSSSPLLGCIADDFTGATDLASNLVEAGMQVVQYLGVPEASEIHCDADAIVIALKTRSADRDEAIVKSLEAVSALQSLGIRRFYFKYCSTFDSTEQGNIGPVAEAIMQVLHVSQTIFCPAFPENHRTVYNGHLFVGDKLLNESGMEHHPLNPMTDANLVRVLSKQSTWEVGCLVYSQLENGPESINEALRTLDADGKRLVIVDALSNQHLNAIAMACADLPLITGGSGLALGLPKAYRKRGLLSSYPSQPSMPVVAGRTAIISGSCSPATRKQVAFIQSRYPTCWLDVRRCVADPLGVVDDILRWSFKMDSTKPLVIASTADIAEVAALQAELGTQRVASSVESALATIALRLVDECGVRRLIIAGGETSGAVVSKLQVRRLRIGPRIVPGVPWTESLDQPTLALALKSGNFGGPDFFQLAVEMISK